MATINSIAPQSFLPLSKPKPKPSISHFKCFRPNSQPIQLSITKHRDYSASTTLVRSLSEELDVIPVQSNDCTDHQDGVVSSLEREDEGEDVLNQVVSGFGNNEGRLSFEGAAGFSSASSSSNSYEEEDLNKLIDRAINATIVLAAGSFAITRLFTIDHDYWHGWTLFEILRYAPQHNWSAYEEALKTNPVLEKMMISGVVYSLGDWIAQALFPFQDWWVVPGKVAFDQTVWAAAWNSIYYVFLGFLRLESPVSIFGELKASFWPMLTAGWKLWPFAHLITYGMIPVEQRLLWVDCVELIWVTILSTISNEKSEARISEAPAEANSNAPSLGYPEE